MPCTPPGARHAVRLDAGQARAWRRRLAADGGWPALVTGSFAIWQPGNLGAVREAARHGRVCIVQTPDGSASRAVTPGMLAALGRVAAVVRCPAKRAEPLLEALRPFTLVDCLAQAPVPHAAARARELAERVVDWPPVPGCFSAEIRAAIRAGRTPIRVPRATLMPAPGPRALRAWLADTDRLRPLVTVNGCFDMLHPGHVRLLQRARALGARLLVLVNDDESVRAYKGAGRPVFPIGARLAALRELGAVSFACPFPGDTPLPFLAVIRPDIHVKGGSFEPARVQAEHDALRGWGGRLAFVPMVGRYSTTRLVDALRAPGPAPQQPG